QVGLISASCLEKDLGIHAKKMLQNEAEYSKVIRYDMSREDDLGWGSGAGCNGIVHVLLEKLHAQLKKDLQLLLHYLRKRLPVTAYKAIGATTRKIRTQYYLENKQMFGTFISDAYMQAIYTQHFFPKERVVIFGAGPDGLPVVNYAQSVGFDIALWDWREHLLKHDTLQTISCYTSIEEIGLASTDYIIEIGRAPCREGSEIC